MELAILEDAQPRPARERVVSVARFPDASTPEALDCIPFPRDGL